MWGAFRRTGVMHDDKLLGVFKYKKYAKEATKHQSAGSADGFWPAGHHDGYIKEVEVVIVGDMAFPIECGVGVEPEIETPKHNCHFCVQEREAAKKKATKKKRKVA